MSCEQPVEECSFLHRRACRALVTHPLPFAKHPCLLLQVIPHRRMIGTVSPQGVRQAKRHAFENNSYTNRSVHTFVHKRILLPCLASASLLQPLPISSSGGLPMPHALIASSLVHASCPHCTMSSQRVAESFKLLARILHPGLAATPIISPSPEPVILQPAR